MALLKQTHPTWSVEQLKALAMNTAGSRRLRAIRPDGRQVRPRPGRLGPRRDRRRAREQLDRVQRGRLGRGQRLVRRRRGRRHDPRSGRSGSRTTARRRRRTRSAMTPRSSIPGVSYSFPDGSSVSVPAGGSATFVVQLDADADAMQNTRDATVAERRRRHGQHPRQWLSEAAGLITLTPSSGPALRVPVYAAARPASTTKARAEVPQRRQGARRATINIAGEGVNTGAEPLGYLSKVTAFELGITPAARRPSARACRSSPAAPTSQYTGAVREGRDGVLRPLHLGRLGRSCHGHAVHVQIDRNDDGTADVTAFTTRFTRGRTPTRSTSSSSASAPRPLSFTNIFNSNVNTAPYNSERPRRPGARWRRSRCRRGRRRSSTGSSA